LYKPKHHTNNVYIVNCRPTFKNTALTWFIAHGWTTENDRPWIPQMIATILTKVTTVTFFNLVIF